MRNERELCKSPARLPELEKLLDYAHSVPMYM